MSRIYVASTFDSVCPINGIVLLHWDACRYSFRSVLSGRIDSVLPLPKYISPVRFNSFSRTFLVKVPTRLSAYRKSAGKTCCRFDNVRKGFNDEIRNRFSRYVPYSAANNNRFDNIRFVEGCVHVQCTFDIASAFENLLRNRYDAVTSFPRVMSGGLFRISSGGKHFLANRFDLLRYTTKDKLSGIFNSYPRGKNRLANRYETLFTLEEIPHSVLHSVYAYDILNRRIFQSPNRFDVILARQPQCNASLRFDSIGTVLAKYPLNRQAFVRPGWRIIARSISTGNTTELGFIDANSPVLSLKDIALPDGDYEVSVLTSSLFWKDCQERIVRTITVGNDIEISTLPLIYNLRSSVTQGFTLIEWSASQNAVDDCLFCMWFSEEPPVDVHRPPDATVGYSDSQTEYRYSYLQSAPEYLAIAAMRSDEHGKIHELFLNWSSVPPRAPDDIVVLDTPLPALDYEIWASHKDESDAYLQQ